MSKTYNAVDEIKQQPDLFGGMLTSPSFPSTRYQGSKYKILEWIDCYTRDLDFHSVLDAFGGTACVSYMFKQQGKQVFCNDVLKFNYYIGLAIIENTETTLSKRDINFILKKHPGTKYSSFIDDTFQGIYFTDEENRWLDVVVTNIRQMQNKYKQALAYYALFQACIIKRPYNLFHRKNLYIRTADVKRSFGNKKTWDAPFENHFIKFAEEANRAVFDNGEKNKALHSDVFDLSVKKDLVYIDTPYIAKNGAGVNYFDFYHFLEGIVHYDQWSGLIDNTTKHRKMRNSKNEWCDKDKIHRAFEKLFEQFKDSLLVVSYRDDGIPTINELVAMLRKKGKSVEVKKVKYKYVLSHRTSREALIIAD